jgi:hypothetical protein
VHHFGVACDDVLHMPIVAEIPAKQIDRDLPSNLVLGTRLSTFAVGEEWGLFDPVKGCGRSRHG